MGKNNKVQRSMLSYQREGSVSFDSKEFRQITEIQLAEKNGKVPQIGQICAFIFNFSSLLLLQLDEPLMAIAEVESNDFLNKSLTFFFSSLTIREHLEPVQKLLRKSIAMMKAVSGVYPVANLEYNVQLSRNRTRRVIFQYTLYPGNRQADAQLAYGKLVDISHLLNGGPPRLHVLQNNKVIYASEASRDELLRSSGIKLNKKDLTVLSLQSKGIRVRDIANKLGMSELSIYSMIRDMKRKTQLETVPLIHLLRNKGLLD
jgi:DNA-binding CsgD family transcriptional regulator